MLKVVNGCIIHLIVVVYYVIPLAQFCRGAGTGNFFTYYEVGGLGPSRWAFLELDEDGSENQCGGTGGTSGYGQSPITIGPEVQAGACDTSMKGYEFSAGSCGWNDLEFSISNNGVKVQPKKDVACSFGQMTIPGASNKKFNALQFHIHTYSEHEIAGKGIGGSGFFPAELHVVHQEVDGDSYAVFGSMISVSRRDQDHELFEWFLRGWEAVSAQVAQSCPDGEIIGRGLGTLQDVLSCPAGREFFDQRTNVDFPNEQAQPPNVYNFPTAADYGFYTYKGGLTTPPCTEVVHWNLLDEPMEISERQLTRLETLILCFIEPIYAKNGSKVKSCKHATVASKTGSTSRPPQPLLGRTVIHRCSSGPDEVQIDDIGSLPESSETFQKPDRVEENPNIGASRCTARMTEDCSEDKRYNPLVSSNLKANAESWYDYEGYWVGKMQVFDHTGKPLLESFASEKFENTFPYPQDTVDIFMNRTIRETRYYETVYFVYKPASEENFCSYAVPDESANVLGGGECGKNGYVQIGEKFGVATHEKDGTVSIIYANGKFKGTTTGKIVPVDEDTFYGIVGGNDGASDFQYSDTESFTNNEHTRISGSGQYFIKSDLPPFSENPLAESYIYEAVQVSSADFAQKLQQSYADNSVKASDQKLLISSGYCVDEENCPDANFFQEHDPLHNDSPYDDATRIKNGWIIYFILWGGFLVLTMLYSWHTHRVGTQVRRYKREFASKISSAVDFDGSNERLTANLLQQEFERIDIDKDGVLSKAELKAFMADRISERDFESMFNAIDINRNGDVDFTEFCAFMAQIGSVHKEKKHVGSDTSASDEEHVRFEYPEHAPMILS